MSVPVALEWSFEKDLCGFTKNQKVRITREKIESDYYLICQSQQTKSTPGIKLMDIILPNDEQEFSIEIDGFANNRKSFIWAINEQNQRLIRSYVFLPELLGSEHHTEPIKATFKLNDINKEKKFCKLTIGVLIGGSSPSTNDIFFLKSIKLYNNTIDNQKPEAEPTNSIQITRVYNSHDELDLDLPNPNRDNNTEMCPGEYALIKSSSDSSDHGKMYVAYADPDLSSAINLKYVCNITGPDNIFTKSFALEENQIIPIYDEDWKAFEDIKNPEKVDEFYFKDGDNNRTSAITNKDGQTFIYFDKQGYIRWLNSEKSIPSLRSASSEPVTLPLEEEIYDNLDFEEEIFNKEKGISNENKIKNNLNSVEEEIFKEIKVKNNYNKGNKPKFYQIENPSLDEKLIEKNLNLESLSYHESHSPQKTKNESYMTDPNLDTDSVIDSIEQNTLIEEFKQKRKEILKNFNQNSLTKWEN